MGIYGLGLTGGFFFDDDPNIVYEPRIKIERLDTLSLKQAAFSGRAGPGGRPVAQLSFAINHYFSGLEPFAFKVTNLVIHLVCGWLVFLLARQLLSQSLPEPQRYRGERWAMVLTALWLLHPIQLLPVLHVVQRMTSLSALFLFVALLLHIGARVHGGRSAAVQLLLAWGLFWPLSFFSKESGALFPGFVLTWELVMRRAQVGRLDGFARLLMCTAGLMVAAGAIYATLPFGKWVWAGYAIRDFSMLDRLLTEWRVLWIYLGLIFFPRLEAFGLQHDDIILSSSLVRPWTTLPAIVGLLVLFWFAWRVRKNAPLICFGIVWFMVAHSLESTLLPLEIAHEHRNYIALFGPLLIVVWYLHQLVALGHWPRTLGLTLTGAILAYCGLITALRAHQFGDAVRRTQIEAQHHPTSSRAQYEAGRALGLFAVHTPYNSPARFLVRSHYELAAELDRNAKLPWLGLIHLNCSAAVRPEPAWLAELIRRLRESPFAPGDSILLYTVKEMAIGGTLCLEQLEVEAIFKAVEANRSVSQYVQSLLHSWMADYLTLSVRDLSAAQIELDKALVIAPHNASNQLKRAQLAYLQGQNEIAKAMLINIPDTQLLLSERETKMLLNKCIASGDYGKCSRL